MKDYREEYDIFMNKYGYDSQALMCIEEMSELTKEICKYNRYKDDKIIENIREELADVFNCIEQLSYYFGFEEVQKIRDFKINRAINHIKNNADYKEDNKNVHKQ